MPCNACKVNMALLLAGFTMRVLIWVRAVDLEIGKRELENRNAFTNLFPLAEDVQVVTLSITKCKNSPSLALCIST
eukprot:5557153-Amphidinium_carterae.2